MNETALRELREYREGVHGWNAGQSLDDISKSPYDGRTRQGQAWRLGFREASLGQVYEVAHKQVEPEPGRLSTLKWCPNMHYAKADGFRAHPDVDRGEVALCADCSEKIEGS